MVVGKLGYSTVAECYRAGTPLAYIRRPHFPESPVLEQFVRTEMECTALTSYDAPALVDALRGLLAKKGPGTGVENGAKQVAREVAALAAGVQ